MKNKSITAKIGNMIADVTHSVQEIPVKKMVKKAAKAISGVIHPATKPAKKRKLSALPVKKVAVVKLPVKKKTAPKAGGNK